MSTVALPADAWQRLRTAGDLLSNVALNVSRVSGNLPISRRAKDSLAECSKEWDAAKEAVLYLLQNGVEDTVRGDSRPPAIGWGPNGTGRNGGPGGCDPGATVP